MISRTNLRQVGATGSKKHASIPEEPYQPRPVADRLRIFRIIAQSVPVVARRQTATRSKPANAVQENVLTEIRVFQFPAFPETKVPEEAIPEKMEECNARWKQKCVRTGHLSEERGQIASLHRVQRRNNFCNSRQNNIVKN